MISQLVQAGRREVCPASTRTAACRLGILDTRTAPSSVDNSSVSTADPGQQARGCLAALRGPLHLTRLRKIGGSPPVEEAIAHYAFTRTASRGLTTSEITMSH